MAFGEVLAGKVAASGIALHGNQFIGVVVEPCPGGSSSQRVRIVATLGVDVVVVEGRPVIRNILGCNRAHREAGFVLLLGRSGILLHGFAHDCLLRLFSFFV